MEGVCCSNDINFGVLQLELEIWSFFFVVSSIKQILLESQSKFLLSIHHSKLSCRTLSSILLVCKHCSIRPFAVEHKVEQVSSHNASFTCITEQILTCNGNQNHTAMTYLTPVMLHLTCMPFFLHTKDARALTHTLIKHHLIFVAARTSGSNARFV